MTAPISPNPCAEVAAVLVAAGKGLRAGGTLPKQFADYGGEPLVRHSARALASAGVAPIVVAIPAGWDDVAKTALAGIEGVRFIHGGESRQQSVRRALESLEQDAPSKVLIHDGARPALPKVVIDRLVAALSKHDGAIPALAVVDSVVRAEHGLRSEAVSRDGLHRVQTPQAFHFAAILSAHRSWAGPGEAGDDSEVAQAAGLTVALVEGDERLRKVTFANDFKVTRLPKSFPRTGMGFDVHRLVLGEDLWLCGVKVPHAKGLAGHSDADVAIHALVDAVLGAVSAGDIGDHFPPSDPRWKGASSDQFLEHAVALAKQAGYDVGNVDVTIICESPKIGPHKQAMRERLAEIVGIDIELVSVKATTTERLGTTGRGEGIAAQALATLLPSEEESKT